MATYRRLTLTNGDTIRILQDAVVVIRQPSRDLGLGAKAEIDLIGGTSYVVRETPEEVERKLSDNAAPLSG